MTTEEWVAFLRRCARSHTADLTAEQFAELAELVQWQRMYLHNIAQEMCVEAVDRLPQEDEEIAFAASMRGRIWRKQLRSLAHKLGVWGNGTTWDGIVEAIDGAVDRLRASAGISTESAKEDGHGR